jgi:hypothetical protein
MTKAVPDGAAFFRHASRGRTADKVADKKTAVLLAPPKFREETSKKAVRLSASARRRMVFAAAACKCFLAATQHFCGERLNCGKIAT